VISELISSIKSFKEAVSVIPARLKCETQNSYYNTNS
jgi:hypothetical protein